jgi:CBS domain-containing protein
MNQVGSLIAGQKIVLVAQELSVREAVRRMADRRIGAVPVADGERVAGIFTERDVMARVVAPGLDPDRTTVADVMTRELVVADPSDTCEDCLRLMKQASVRHLLVLSEGRLAGIVSLRDLLRFDADEKQLVIRLLNAYVHDIPVTLSPQS